jgi:hypothetical protein
MAVAQGINKKTVYKKQTALGSSASGSGGQILRRETSTFAAPADTYTNNEIVSHQQSTGVTHGVVKPMGQISGVLSPATYATLLASLLRKDLVSAPSASSLSITVAASGSNYTLTRGSGDFLSDGFKIGNVVRITAGTYTAGTKDKNLLIIALTATVMTVKVINGSALTAEGPIASSTIAATGKKTYVPTTSHTNDYYTFEEYYSDLTKSETYADCQVAQAQIDLPATGNATIQLDVPGRTRTLGNAQVLTSPTAETTTDPLAAVNGVVMVNGSVVANVTGAQVTINGNTAHSDAVVGSNTVDDMQRGRVAVSGQFSAKFDGTTLQAIYDARSAISLVLCITEDGTATADFVVLTLPAIKLTNDSPNDGEVAIVRTYPFEAQYNGAGGTGTTSEQSIVAIQDSAA